MYVILSTFNVIFASDNVGVDCCREMLLKILKIYV